LSEVATAPVTVNMRTALVSGYHEKGEECPELFRARSGEWVACNHDSHVEPFGETASAEELRRRHLIEEVLPGLVDKYVTLESESTEKKPARGNQQSSSSGQRKRPGKTPRDCVCGCGEQTKGGRFVPGHDAKMRGKLIRAAQNTDLRLPDRIDALRQLREHKWDAAIPDHVKEQLDDAE